MDDPGVGLAEARAGVESVLADPDRAGSIVETPMGEMPFEVVMGQFGCMDLLVHTWDLARATGGDERIDADAANRGLRSAQAHGRDAPWPRHVQARPSSLPAGADAQTRLLSFLGRQV